MITNEREFEDYLERHISDLIKEIQGSFHISQEIKYIGRQVVVGKENRLDMLFSYDTINDSPFEERMRSYIVVELKFRQLTLADISQLSRYMDAVDSAAHHVKDNIVTWDVKGILIGPRLSYELGMVHSHALDNDSIKLWVITDDMDIYKLEDKEFAGLTEVGQNDIDERFIKNINSFVKATEE